MLFGAYSQQYKNASDSIIASQASPDDPVAYWKVAEPHHKKAVKDFMQGGGKFLLKAFGFNILENTRSDNQVFHFYEESERKWKSINIVQKITYYQNILFTLALIGSSAFIAISFFAAQNYKRPLFWFITVTTAIAMYFLLVSGISHWQGDRFNYVCYPLTIILVSFIVFYQRNKKRDQYPNQA